MKRVLLLTFLAAFLSTAASAQSQPVRVVSYDGIELAFSYVYVNGKPIGVADKDGRLIIPAESIHKGDTISATYVGYNKGGVVYDKYRKDSYTIKLTSDIVEKVTVYGRKETRQEFRKIRRYPPMSLGHDFKCRAVFDINGKEYWRGNIYNYAVSMGMSNTYLEAGKDMSIINDQNKITMFNDIVVPVIQYVFNSAAKEVDSNIVSLAETGTAIRKIKNNGRIQTFSLYKENNQLDNGDAIKVSSVQLDVDTLFKDVVEARMEIENTYGKLELTATYKIFDYFRADGAEEYLFRGPNLIEAMYRTNDGTVFTIDMYDIERQKKVGDHNRRNSLKVYNDSRYALFQFDKMLEKNSHLIP